MHRTLLSDFTGPLISLSAAAKRRRPARARAGFAAIRRRWLSPQRLLIACLVAVVAAAVLVVYLERRAAALQRVRTDMVVRQVCERTAAALATRTRELFGAGVLATIEAIGHREIEQYHLTRIDDVLSAGARSHAFVDRFFFWHERMPSRFDRQLLFYRPPGEAGVRDVPAGGASRGAFYADPGRGAALWQTGQRLGALAQSFAVEEVRLDGKPYQAVFHFMWSNPQRSATFSIVGYLVDLDDLRANRFARIVAHGLAPLLNPGAELPRLTLRVEDAAGQRITGPDLDSSELPSASERFDLLFFPSRELGNYLAPLPAVASWRLIVRPEAPLPDGSPSGLWLLGAVVGLLLIAVVLRRRRQPRGDPPVAAAVRLRAQRVAPAADAAGDAVRRGRDARPRAAPLARQDQALRRHRAGADQAPVGAGRPDPARAHGRSRRDRAALAARRSRSAGGAGGRRRAAARGSARRGHRGGPPAPPLVHVDGDPVALEHVILNLLENAVKYGSDTGNEVRVGVRAAGKQAVVTVADRGAGIARADLPHIFEKFYRGRVEGPTRRGFGLGLAIVRAAIDAHGGTVAVSSEPGRGSVFTVSLPLAS